MGRLEGRVAVITGAGAGIGKAIAKCFAAEGARVAVVSIEQSEVSGVVKEITNDGYKASGWICDIGDEQQIGKTVESIIDTFGTVNILVNNAFELSSATSSVEELDVYKLQRQFDTGPIACLHLMQKCYPYLRRGGGRVINFGSSAGLQGQKGFAPYAMAKEAIRALSRVAAREWGSDGITVNNILPTARTESVNKWLEKSGQALPDLPIARYGSPDEDIAPVALFLASSDSKYITGYSFMADGGYMIDAAR